MSKITIRPWLYNQRVLADGTAQVCLVATCNRQRSIIPLGIYVDASMWMPECGEVNKGFPNGALINNAIQHYLIEARAVALLMESQGEKIESKDLKTAIVKRLFPAKREESDKPKAKPKPKFGSLSKAFDAHTANKAGKTLESYQTTKRKLIAYLGQENYQQLDIDKMGRGWLADFDMWLSDTCRTNARAVYMRNLRAVCNYAIDEGLATKYPFRGFKIKTIKTAKRSLSIEQLRQLWHYPCEQSQRQYLDFFKLSFLLCGINPIDLLQLPKDAIINGRLIYNRSKTKRLYSIKVEPEAMNLIKQYSGDKHLLRFLDHCTNQQWFRRRATKTLGEIGPVAIVGKHGKKVRTPLWPDLTMYWARHTWATLASELDIPRETIAQGLGHAWQSVTDIYIKYDMKKVDEANRKIIDFVLQKGKFAIKKKAIAQ